MSEFVTELDKIKIRIVGLAKKTIENGCTEHEALAAMAMVGKLLQSYNLTMAECDVRKSKCKTLEISVNGSNRGPMDNVIVNLAALFSGRTWFQKRYKKNEAGEYKLTLSYAFYIQEQDSEALQYLFEVISKAIETEAVAYKSHPDYKYAEGSKKSAYVSFQRGMSHRISSRLAQLRRENDEAMEAARAAGTAQSSSTGTSLVVLKGQLIEEEFKKEGIRLRKYHSSERIRNHNAYDAGRAAGDRVNLNRPLGGGRGNAGLLG